MLIRIVSGRFCEIRQKQEEDSLNGKTNSAVLERTVQIEIKDHAIYLAVKRIMDVIGSAAALIFSGPVILGFALAIYLDDPHGSPFFSQSRVGRDGKEFKFWKLRIMVCNAEDLLKDLQDRNEMEGPAFKIKEDPRITRIGHFIRKTSIYELPQFWNVLKGDMSIVGPRPPLPREVERYTPYQRQRLMVKPGITCIWQVQHGRNDFTFDEWVDLDIEYIEHRSLWLDIKLMMRTAAVMFGGEGR